MLASLGMVRWEIWYGEKKRKKGEGVDGCVMCVKVGAKVHVALGAGSPTATKRDCPCGS